MSDQDVVSENSTFRKPQEKLTRRRKIIVRKKTKEWLIDESY